MSIPSPYQDHMSEVTRARAREGYITVPEGMSCVNAFRALWERSRPAVFFLAYPEAEKPQALQVSTAEKVAELFKTHTYFDYMGGRLLKTHFTEFPYLVVKEYDEEYGDGAASAALALYAQKPPGERFDKNDSYKFMDLVPTRPKY